MERTSTTHFFPSGGGSRSSPSGGTSRSSPSGGTSRRLKRVLFVEDELDIQIVARLALEDIGQLEVAVCGSGSEALEIAPLFRPELILLDVMMPEPDGPTTLKALAHKPETASMPVVFVTAKAQHHEIEEYLDLGAIDVIVKPFDPMTLADRVQEIWRRHRGEVEGR